MVAVWTGIGSGLATFVFLLFGVTRAYDLDDSLTVGVFVATPSISDAFTQAYVLNNHVFFSFLEHLVYTSTGSQSEPVMRMLPIVFAAVVRWRAGVPAQPALGRRRRQFRARR